MTGASGASASGQRARAGVGRSWRGEHHFVWHCRAGLWVTELWGRPTTADVRELGRIYEHAFAPEMEPSFVSLVGCARLRGAESEAFEALAEYMRARRARFHERMARQAIVRPGGLAGSIVSGFFEVLGYTLPVRVFTTVPEGLAWLLPAAEPALAESIAARAADEASQDAVLAALRERLAGLPGGLTVESAARSLGLSTRSLQRRLELAGTSFRAEVNRVRIERARELLERTDEKIAAVSSAVGCASARHFGRLFREATGLAPGEWRRARRGPRPGGAV